MGFWQNVEDECEYLGISRKELAKKAEFSVHTISNGIKRNGMPAADLALKISKVLNVPLEKLLGINAKNQAAAFTESEKQKQDKKLYAAYLPLVKKINHLQDDSKKALMTIIEKLK